MKVSKIRGFYLIKCLLFLILCIFLSISFLTYNSIDPSLNSFSEGPVLNKQGKIGAFTADLFLQFFGLSAFLIPLNLAIWALLAFRKVKIDHMIRIGALILCLCIFSTLVSAIENYRFYFDFLIGGFIGYFLFLKITTILFYKPILWFIGLNLPFLYIYSTGVFNLFFYRTKSDIKPVRNPKSKENPRTIQPKIQNKDYDPPSLDFLTKPTSDNNSIEKNMANVSRLKETLIKVLADFGIKGEIIGVRVGPILTVFELEPEAGIRATRIIGLADDIARYLKATSARITLIPGKSTLGIEIPNKFRDTVFLHELLISDDFRYSSAGLPIVLGKTIDSTSVVVDLAKMPHLLIAGTTGSGKSVGVNAMILSLLYKLPPSECKFLMIDPKMLEFSVYEGIPHLLSPVITDPAKAVLALKWVTKEMERRYKLMSELGVRNIIGYNTTINDKNGLLPYIVVIVDEMADLMLTAGKAIEASIQRLAQMARASGIHIILATQRPSVDVITGIIKANFPIRVSYQVASSMDSRTIIGYQGAEKLLGQGDMLYMPTGGKTIRLHGPFVSDSEIANVVNYLKNKYGTTYNEDIDQFTQSASIDELGDVETSFNEESEGDLYEMAVKIVLSDKKPSISYVQRRLKIGYNKAANLIERMQEEGIISEPDQTGKRIIIQKS